MSQATLSRPAAPVEQQPVRKARRFGGNGLLHAFTWVVIAWLLLPIFVMIVFGFNNPKGRYNQTWDGFTFKWYGRLFAIPDLTNALITSLVIAVIAVILATSLGTGIGYGVTKLKVPLTVRVLPNGLTVGISTRF